MFSILSILIFITTLFSVLQINAQTSTPPPPSHGDFGGTKKDRKQLFDNLLENITSAQSAVIRDQNSLLTEGIKAFNITFSVQVQSYAVTKSTFASNKPNCDIVAKQKSDEIITKARDDTISCLATFREQVLRDGKGFNDIRQLPLERLVAVIDPLDDCFQELKVSTVKSFGQVTIDHIVCSKK